MSEVRKHIKEEGARAELITSKMGSCKSYECFCAEALLASMIRCVCAHYKNRGTGTIKTRRKRYSKKKEFMLLSTTSRRGGKKRERCQEVDQKSNRLEELVDG